MLLLNIFNIIHFLRLHLKISRIISIFIMFFHLDFFRRFEYIILI